ncbi:MAG: RNA polymerase sigma factor [Bacteroidetes bacterium]|jgi:RNA polymerase sigma-70 factor (ECF subfamily)|nr:RNA polymerase sigma factor [Bacteroidota bacterium]
MTTAEYNKTVDLYADSLYRFVVKSMRNADSAQDVVQDTFEKIWRHVDDVQYDTAKSYLFSVGYRTMIDHLRRNKMSVGLDLADEPWHLGNEGNFDIQEVLEHALNQLPTIQKTVVMLRDYEGYSYDEIGQITNLNESQVKVYIFRARKALKEFIGKIEMVA